MVDERLRRGDQQDEQTVRLTGYAREQLIGSAFQDYFTEPERAVAGVQKTLSEGYVTLNPVSLKKYERHEVDALLK